MAYSIIVLNVKYVVIVITLFAIVPVSEITCQTYAIYPIAVIVQNLSNQITSVLLK